MRRPDVRHWCTTQRNDPIFSTYPSVAPVEAESISSAVSHLKSTYVTSSPFFFLFDVHFAECEPSLQNYPSSLLKFHILSFFVLFSYCIVLASFRSNFSHIYSTSTSTSSMRKETASGPIESIGSCLVHRSLSNRRRHVDSFSNRCCNQAFITSQLTFSLPISNPKSKISR